ncbi:hypothetical protein [Bradyrhizobium sp.]|uniref:hypothetical protein n=1 Tax=Bradyrhizobium sp. TaxID=376 RepID=UPI001D1EA1B9|nr:hypothetical protein [Bradyrhizobium sp.]MBV8700013.1 hypothetical protein [Bradyrhizobium sp.]MBV8918836.1 hypothetical protein [Bradyrhizobium sp.]MBV9980410.1 hypothetical protein [Bradyrhizobium sp.]
MTSPDTFDLTFLGTSASVPSAERNHPSLLKATKTFPNGRIAMDFDHIVILSSRCGGGASERGADCNRTAARFRPEKMLYAMMGSGRFKFEKRC